MFFGILPIDKREFSIGDVQQPLKINWKANPDSLYTLLIWDEDAPYPQDPKFSPLLHYLVINIPGNNVDKGQEIVSYIPPNPPKDSAPHFYNIGIYEQQAKIKNIPSIKERKRFNVKEFLNKNKLKYVKEVPFSVNPAIIEITAPVKEEMDVSTNDLDAWSSSTTAGGLPQRGRYSGSNSRVPQRSMSPRSRKPSTSKDSSKFMNIPAVTYQEKGKSGCGCGGGASTIAFQPDHDGSDGERPTDHKKRVPRKTTKYPSKSVGSRTASSPRSMSPRSRNISYNSGKILYSKGKRSVAYNKGLSPRTRGTSLSSGRRGFSTVGRRPNQLSSRRVFQAGQSRGRTSSPVRSVSPKRQPRTMSPRSRKGKDWEEDIAKSCSGEVSEEKMKSYSCSIDVANKNDESCTKDQWGTRKSCVNPWAVCAKSTGTSMGRSNEISKCLDFNNMSLERLRGYARLHDIDIPLKANKQTILAKINAWKEQEGK